TMRPSHAASLNRRRCRTRKPTAKHCVSVRRRRIKTRATAASTTRSSNSTAVPEAQEPHERQRPREGGVFFWGQVLAHPRASSSLREDQRRSSEIIPSPALQAVVAPKPALSRRAD